MIRRALFCLVIFVTAFQASSAQENYLEYFRSVARAESLLVAGLHREALVVYDSLAIRFAWNDPSDCYIAAQLAAHLGDTTRCRETLKRGLCVGLPVESIRSNPRLAPYSDPSIEFSIAQADLDSCLAVYAARINPEARSAALALARADQVLIHDRLLAKGRTPYLNDGRTLKPELRPVWDSLLNELIAITTRYGFPAERITGTHAATDSLFSVGSSTQYGWYLLVHHGNAWPKLKAILLIELSKGNISPRLYASIADQSDSGVFRELPFMALRSCDYDPKTAACKRSVGKRITAIDSSRASIGLCSYAVLEGKEVLKQAYSRWTTSRRTEPIGLAFDFIGVGWEGSR